MVCLEIRTTCWGVIPQLETITCDSFWLAEILLGVFSAGHGFLHVFMVLFFSSMVLVYFNGIYSNWSIMHGTNFLDDDDDDDHDDDDDDDGDDDDDHDDHDDDDDDDKD